MYKLVANEKSNPTAVMLSHISPIKDILNAIKSADVIVNKIGIRDYKLLIYGSVTKDVNYTSMCIDLIQTLNLNQNVSIMGLGNGPKVLNNGWIFLNSSVSEGLPLALGEAGLAGLPVVCTDVGGSIDIVQDDEGIVYGAYCAPNNPVDLAYAQIKVLGMYDGLHEYIIRGDKMVNNSKWNPLDLTPASITQRMYEMIDSRRELGFRYRNHVLKHFNMSRYLFEHNQILNISDLKSKQKRISKRRIPEVVLSI